MQSDSRLPSLETIFTAHPQKLWVGGLIEVAHVEYNRNFEQTLMRLNGRGQLQRGLESIATVLAAEKKGIDAANLKQNLPMAQRISRLLIMADGGTERFYRGCEQLLREHDKRLLGLRMDFSNSEMLAKLYGMDAMTKALLVSHRDAVTETLWSLI